MIDNTPISTKQQTKRAGALVAVMGVFAMLVHPIGSFICLVGLVILAASFALED